MYERKPIETPINSHTQRYNKKSEYLTIKVKRSRSQNQVVSKCLGHIIAKVRLAHEHTHKLLISYSVGSIHLVLVNISIVLCIVVWVV